jgi:predicted glycosyltransferase
VRVWIDLTNSPHVLVMRPVIEGLRAQGHEVQVTARDFAQTLGLLERLRIDHTAIGRHRGGSLLGKARGIASRSAALTRWARRHGPFDVALGHGSNDLSVAAALLRIPSSTMFDYEWASIQHNVNCRLAQAVVVPEAIPPERLARYGAAGKLRRYAGLKEEYYLADFMPRDEVLAELGLDPARPIVTVRTPPELALYHRFENDLFGTVLARLRAAATERGLQTVVLPRTQAQREQLRDAGELTVPDKAIDAQSLICFSELVISAGGTMNREAVALGVPVYSTFAGRLGGVDERLIAEGRLRLLSDPDAVDLDLGQPQRPGLASTRVRREVQVLIDLLLSPRAAGR